MRRYRPLTSSDHEYLCEANCGDDAKWVDASITAETLKNGGWPHDDSPTFVCDRHLPRQNVNLRKLIFD